MAAVTFMVLSNLALPVIREQPTVLVFWGVGVCLLVGSCTVDAGVGLAFLWSSPRPISTSQLNLLPGLHFWPINPLVWVGALPPCRGGRPHLEAGFPLRCFQRLSLPNVANQPCPWRDNWHTRGSSVPVLSY